MCEHGCYDATTDEATIEEWWSQTPNANIGIATGKTSGLYVIDVDRHGDVDGFITLEDAGIDLPETMSSKTPSGGEHWFYKWTQGDEPSQGSNVNGYSGVDVRANGGYVVAPGSVVDGVQYEWLIEMEPVEFPEELKKRNVIRPRSQEAIVEASNVRERARAYLAKCDPAVQGQSGHSTLLRVASKLVVGFNLSDADALDLLWSEYNPRCIPPWDPNNAKDVKDFERKVTEARNHPVGEFGALLNDSRYDVNDEEVKAIGRRVAFGKIGVVHISNKIEMPEIMLHPPGLVGVIYNFILEGANRPQPIFALATALIVVGTTYARSVQDAIGNMTNLFFLAVADSGGGKDWPQKSIDFIFEAVWDKMGDFTADIIQTNDATSDAALERKLADNPVLTMVVDEVADYFKSIKTSEKTGASAATVKRFLKQAYSWHAGGCYKGKLYAARADGRPRERIRIKTPWLSFFGATQPAALPNAITSDEIIDGFLPRLMLLAPETEPPEDRSRFLKRTIPDSIIMPIVRWFRRISYDPTEILSTESRRPPKNSIVVPSTPEAEGVFDALCDRIEKKRIAAKTKGDFTMPIYSRVHENARRIALVLAVGNVDMPEYARVDANCATFGAEMAEYLADVMCEYLRLNLADGEFDKAKTKIHQLIRHAGANGLTKKQLAMARLGVKNRSMREDALNDLVEAGMIREMVTIGKTKPTRTYYDADLFSE